QPFRGGPAGLSPHPLGAAVPRSWYPCWCLARHPPPPFAVDTTNAFGRANGIGCRPPPCLPTPCGARELPPDGRDRRRRQKPTIPPRGGMRCVNGYFAPRPATVNADRLGEPKAASRQHRHGPRMGRSAACSLAPWHNEWRRILEPVQHIGRQPEDIVVKSVPRQ